MEILVLVSSRFGQVNRANTWEGVQTFEDDIILTGANSDIVLAATAKVRLDGSISGDTFIQQSSSNVMNFVAGNVSRLQILSDVVVQPATDFVVQTTRFVRLDGNVAGDTNIRESAANNMQFTAGALVSLDLNATGIGLFGTTPAAQQVHVADPTDLATCITAITAINAKDATYGLTAAV